MANNTTGLTRIIKAAGYSWKGFRAAWVNEAAFRQEGIAAVVAVAIACWVDVDAITRVLLISSVLLVTSRAVGASERHGIGGGIAGDHHRADRVGNAFMSKLPLTPGVAARKTERNS